MAQGFKLDIENEFAEFASEFSSTLGVEVAKSLVFSGQVLQGLLMRSTSDKLKKNPKGTLKNSWTVGPIKLGESAFKVDVFSLVPYAAIHETGGVIHPKRVKALAVPNRRFRKIIKNGVPIAPREYDPGRTRLEFAPALNPARLRGYLLDAETDLPFVQRIAYYLMANVTIKPTGYVTKAIKKATPEILEITGGALVTAMGKAG
jgi:hypothetical protein